MRTPKSPKHPSRNGLALTSIFMLPDVYKRYQEICIAEGSTASVRLREFVGREVRRADKRASL